MSDSSVTLRRLTFRKNERLCSRKIIQELSLKGKNIHLNPLRLVWMPVQLPLNSKVQAAFTVPKRIFKDATDRNRMKRRMRESYRKNKSSFYPLVSQGNLQYALLFVFTGKELISYEETEEKTKIILHRLVEDIQKNSR
jgi:ribonuclease P protein component